MAYMCRENPTAKEDCNLLIATHLSHGPQAAILRWNMVIGQMYEHDKASCINRTILYVDRELGMTLVRGYTEK